MNMNVRRGWVKEKPGAGISLLLLTRNAPKMSSGLTSPLEGRVTVNRILNPGVFSVSWRE